MSAKSEAKRDLEIAKATGDTEAIKAAEQKVAQKQANMRAYVKETGRPRRYDREAIGGQKIPEGYKGWRAQSNSDIPFTGAVNAAKAPKMSDEAQKIVDGLKASGVKYNKVSEYTTQPRQSEIIARLAGGDRTKGSCSSLAFAYAGNMNGIDCLDFRGGNSQSYFSRNGHIQEIAKLPGVKSQIIEVEREAGDTWKILKDLPLGTEYYLAVGKHASIVRNTAAGVEYLELQSRRDDLNGWQRFEGNPIWDTPMKVLQKRFGCRKTIDKVKMFSGDFVFKKKVVLMEVDSFKGNDDFKQILGYINTPAGEQQKGINGGIK